MILAEWQVAKSNAREFQRLVEGPFDLGILDHSLALETANVLIAQIGQMDEPPAVLAIRLPHESGELDVRVHILDLRESPGWIRDEVAKMLESRKPATQSSMHPAPLFDYGGLQITGIIDTRHPYGFCGIPKECMHKGIVNFAEEKPFLRNDGFIDVHCGWARQREPRKRKAADATEEPPLHP
jgi:hypothetical protein